MHNEYVDTLSNPNDMIAAQLEVLEYFRRNDIPAICVELLHHSISDVTISQIQRGINNVSRNNLILKRLSSGFSNPQLEEILTQWAITDLIIMGFNAVGCVKETADDALARNKGVYTALDIIANIGEYPLAASCFDPKVVCYDSYRKIISL